MKLFLKGICLGVSLCFANKLCCYSFDGNIQALIHSSVLIFFIITSACLISKTVSELLLCGFIGLLSMFSSEILTIKVFGFLFDRTLNSYIAGFWGPMLALTVSLILTILKINLPEQIYERSKNMSTDLSKAFKAKLLIYSIISAIGFSYLVLPESAGISIPLFVLLQTACLWFIVPNKKRLFLLIPVFLISLNSFMSSSDMWTFCNLIISFVVFSCMFVEFDFKSNSMGYITNIIHNAFTPFLFFHIPFKWSLELNSEKAPVLKRIVIALLLALPCAVLLIAVLSSADMVFSIKTKSFLDFLTGHLNFHTLFIGICGIIAGLYLFGTLLIAHCKLTHRERAGKIFRGDMIIINILLSVILFVYTLFVIIQFKYLFAGSVLPDGLSYTEYARKGFFELLALTGINITAILITIKLTSTYKNKWSALSKGLCHYLCAITVILLISSFYRMWLYTGDDGLTRLRLFVMGFLAFEAIGLIFTFVYIHKPRFNITLIYACLALVYYIVLNITPTDNIIAKNQISKFLNGERNDIHYVFTLSADAAPAMESLYSNTADEQVKLQILEFLEHSTITHIPERWQRYNLSTEHAKNILSKIGN